MKVIRLILVMALAAIVVLPATGQKSKFASTEDSLSYALGVANYMYYAGDSININTKMFSKGMSDASKERALMNDTAASAFIVSYMQRREKARLMAEYSQRIEAAKAWLADNAMKEGVITSPSGLQYKVLQEGTGATPGPEDIVKVHYTGKTIEGNKFDSSYDRGEPAQFRVSNVIRGWVEGLQLMKEGSRMMLYIPYDLAYGERGAGNIIKPFETLIFEVELFEVIKEE
ncbi:MAG: FKBP-type peptidyl-prolyl cis-trans isomerase [Bacteroidales bacterium]|jgi:FKBP-type peptidyl-prolyl cis-trans isomerase FklB|nr:FKBP-type peptidyl-prolyl cis-trans isomerase [Bacteroidales bacterium]HOR09208.1 FKBP-type peptidyl-prolyl cis-trans isomerase [Bacteroidales bacterium]HPK85066.1 FKBP-type peptidyl-prolyl cis-trans isomerase [Bacteroidales bacterium]